jgi:large subunit ribosomal protein L28
MSEFMQSCAYTAVRADAQGRPAFHRASEHKNRFWHGRSSAKIAHPEIQHQGLDMAQKCEICGKGPQYGNVISHANNVRRRRWNPNLRKVRALVNGARKQLRVCTSCIRSGRVKKAA